MFWCVCHCFPINILVGVEGALQHSCGLFWWSRSYFLFNSAALSMERGYIKLSIQTLKGYLVLCLFV